MPSLVFLAAVMTAAPADAPRSRPEAPSLMPSAPSDLDPLRAEVQRLEHVRIGLGLPVTLMATGSSVTTIAAMLFLIGLTSGLAPFLNVPTLMGLVGLVTGVPMVGFGAVGLRWRVRDRANLKEDLDAARTRLREAESGAIPVMPTGPSPSPLPAARVASPLMTLARFD